MEIVIAADADDCAARATDLITAAMADRARRLGLATGTSPLAVYAELTRRHRYGLSFAGMSAFLLDEYVGLPREHPASYHRVIREVFTDHVDLDPQNVHGPNGCASNVVAAAAAYERLLSTKGPVDIQLLGIGGNGHIGFTNPVRRSPHVLG